MSFQEINRFSKYNKKYRMMMEHVTFKLGSVPFGETDVEAFLKKEFNDLIDSITSSADEDDEVGFVFTSDKFHREGYLSFRKRKLLNIDDVWELLGAIYQSNAEGFDTDLFRIRMTAFKPFKGGIRPKDYITFDEECQKRKGIVSVTNKDNLCLPRALVIAMAYAENSPYVSQIRRNVGKIQDKKTQDLITVSGIEIPPDGAGLSELYKFQDYLSDYQITVYEYGSKGRKTLFKGGEAPYKINLLFHQDHYNVITSLTAAFCCSYYCQNCHVPYNTLDHHYCEKKCPCCFSSPGCDNISEIRCDSCRRSFRSILCFNNHRKPTKHGSICETVVRCLSCHKIYRSEREHVCGEIFCRNCYSYQPRDHRCFIQVDRRSPDLEDSIFIFYDIETRLDEFGGNKVHTPVLCVVQQRCRTCFEMDNNVARCVKCGYRQTVIDKDVIPAFMKHVLSFREEFKKITVIAHNSKGFDCQFILKYLINETDLTPLIIMRGTKIMLLKLFRISFIDSLNYFPMRLADLPSAFDLGGVTKGFFPHLFNTNQNKSYIGPMPPIEFYAPDDMNTKTREEFLVWYRRNKNRVFDLNTEMVHYCISDVDILTKACLKFHKLFMELCNVSPFTEYITIAAATHGVYRRNFLKPYTLGVLPHSGYRKTQNQSKIASMWLLWLEAQNNITIQHSLRGPEAIVDGMRVDGFHDKTVYEFLGSFWHGHTCIKKNRDQPLYKKAGDTLESRYTSTLERLRHLNSARYEVVSIWECQFNEILNKDRTLRDKLLNNPLMVHLPLKPRDAFYGGRTGNTKIHYKALENEKIRYNDITSLYPYICKYGRFPIGHPNVYVGDECEDINLEEIEGLIKCKILPPDNLYHPVLPTKMNDKLMFILCNSCGLSMNQGSCNHADEDRALTGTWVMDEVRLAIDKGYEVKEVYEIWQYNTIQFDKATGNLGLFSEMMDTFVKIKTEASGWGQDCVTSEQREAYIAEFLDKEGVQLEPANMVKNPGLRSLAKLILNAFWGRFGQNKNLPKTTIVRECYELYDLMSNPIINVESADEVNDEVLLVNWTKNDTIEEPEEEVSNVNVVVACYVTAQARIKLYSYLDRLGSAVLYYDTDSVIYVARENEWTIPTGHFLGDMTDVLEKHGSGSYITEFTSGGPKNYAYRVFTPSTAETSEECKVKGINITYAKSKLINYDVMTDMALHRPSSSVSISSSEIGVDPRSRDVVTRELPKMYRIRSEKRIFDEDQDSRPYGSKQN